MDEYDIAVVGGGPAGMSAASAAVHCRARVILFEEFWLGGHTNHREPPEWARAEAEHGYWAHPMSGMTETVALMGVDFYPPRVVWGVFPGFEIAFLEGEVSRVTRAKRLVIATGTTARVRSFRGSDLPGVMTGDGLLRMVERGKVWPGGRRIAIVGGDTALIEMIQRSANRHGGQVVSISDGEPVVSARNGVVASIQESAEAPAIATDIVAICAGEQPDISLALMLECETGYSKTLGGFVPRRTRLMEMSVPGAYVCGGAAGVGTVGEYMVEGAVAGRAAATSLGLPLREGSEGFERWLVEEAPERAAAADTLVTGWTQHRIESVQAVEVRR